MRRVLKISIVLTIFLALLAYGIFYVNRQTKSFFIESTNPRTSSISYLTPYIDITFNKELEGEFADFGVTANENIIIDSEINGRVLRVYIDRMLSDEEYEIIIPFIETKNGERLENVKVEFTAKNIPFDKISKEHQQFILDRQDFKPPGHTDPILDHLPYSTLDFELSPLYETDKFGRRQLTLEAKLMLSAADARSDTSVVIAQYKKEVINYIRSLNLDPDKYNIRYEVIKPTL